MSTIFKLLCKNLKTNIVMLHKNAIFSPLLFFVYFVSRICLFVSFVIVNMPLLAFNRL